MEARMKRTLRILYTCIRADREEQNKRGLSPSLFLLCRSLHPNSSLYGEPCRPLSRRCLCGLSASVFPHAFASFFFFSSFLSFALIQLSRFGLFSLHLPCRWHYTRAQSQGTEGFFLLFFRPDSPRLVVLLFLS